MILLLSTHSYSQHISGYLYDQDGRVPNFPLLNTTQDLYSNSNSDGYFKIQANVGDSIVLKSIAYKTVTFEVNTDQIENEMVIELEPDDLEEVVVYGYNINSRTLSKNFNEGIKKDIDNNPTLYEPSKGNIGYLLHGLIGLFTRGEESEEQNLEERKLKTHDFISLFKKDEFLNEDFLADELELPEKYHNLFFDYLGSKGISYTFLEKEKKLELIDLILKYSTDFKSTLSSSADL
ncbi:MAG: hypothetical protein WBV11_07790 [Salegentibacter sp.]